MVKSWTSLISGGLARGDIAPPSPPPLLSAVLNKRLNGAFRRRLSDRVASVFDEACLTGDLDTAEQLLAVLEGMHDRRQAAMGDRRLNIDELLRARDELATRKAARGED